MLQRRLVSLLAAMLVFGFIGGSCAAGENISGDDVKRQAGEALDAAKKYALQQKVEYQQKVEQELAELRLKIASLREKAHGATGESLRMLQDKLEALRERQAVAEKKLGELRASTSQAWHEMREGLEKAVSEVKKAYDNAARLFK